MSPRLKMAAFGVVLAASVGVGAGIGSVAGPFAPSADANGSPADQSHTDESHTDQAGAAVASTNPSEPGPAGLSVTEDGYRFVPVDRLADAGPFAFTIIGPDGEPVRDFDVLHGRELHLLVASTDLRSYAHLHAERDSVGQWVADLPPLPAGPYRAFADFKPVGGGQHTLGMDLVAPGTIGPPAALELSDHTVVDGFEVGIDDQGTSLASSEVVVTVRRDGLTVVTEPYLDAAGHLVALRDGDLAYLHVHPLDETPTGPVRFAVEVPTAGVYALFFDFQVDGVVRNARFVLRFDDQSTVGTSADRSH